jgi:hypothetical protein
MTEGEFNLQGEGVPENDRLDRELDAALAKYAAAEPRAGLEQRVLATVRAERERRTAAVWWRWPAMTALAASLIVVAATLASRLWTPEQKTANQHAPQMQAQAHDGTKVASPVGSSEMHVHKTGSRRGGLGPRAVSKTLAVVASVPKLDRFPSPQPLSEQERILMSYIAEFPSEATLVARLRTEERRRDQERETKEFADGIAGDDSE